MKQLFIVLIIVLLTPFMACANPPAELKDETQYQVNIEIQYNSVSADEAQKIIAEALKKHSKACTVDAKAKKLSGGNGYIIWNDEDPTFTPLTNITTP